MANRLSKITTRTGDDGTTGLGDGSRVDKDHPRIIAIGDVDELNSALGLVLTEPLPGDLRDLLVAVQHDLFDLGGELSIPGHNVLQPARIAALDRAVSGLNAALPPLKEFILPGGVRSAALCHLARTVCRRAERSVCALGRTEPLSTLPVTYLNRLSDLLFVMARTLNRSADVPETVWQRRSD